MQGLQPLRILFAWKQRKILQPSYQNTGSFLKKIFPMFWFETDTKSLRRFCVGVGIRSFSQSFRTWNSLTWGKSVLATRQTSEHRQDVLRGSCFLLLIEQHHCLMVGVNITLFSVSFIYVRCGRFEFWRFFDHRTNNVCFDFVHMQYFSMQAIIYVCDEISKR